MKKQPFEQTRNRINKLSEALLGGAEEIDAREAEDILRTAGFNADELGAKLYPRLLEEARHYWAADKPLPELLKKALEDLRPCSAPPRNERELATQAKSRLERLLEQAKQFGSGLAASTPAFIESYRNKKGLSEIERRTLDEIKDQLASKIQRHKEGR